jgi:hypothetical protein
MISDFFKHVKKVVFMIKHGSVEKDEFKMFYKSNKKKKHKMLITNMANYNNSLNTVHIRNDLKYKKPRKRNNNE